MAVRKLAPAQPERKTLKAQGVSYRGAHPCEEWRTPRITGDGQLNGNVAVVLFIVDGEKCDSDELTGSPAMGWGGARSRGLPTPILGVFGVEVRRSSQSSSSLSVRRWWEEDVVFCSVRWQRKEPDGGVKCTASGCLRWCSTWLPSRMRWVSAHDNGWAQQRSDERNGGLAWAESP
jgi:hypothetical protein